MIIRNVKREDIETKSRFAGKSTDLIDLLTTVRDEHNLYAGPTRQVIGLNTIGARILYEDGEIKEDWDAVILSTLSEDESETVHSLYVRDKNLGVGSYTPID